MSERLQRMRGPASRRVSNRHTFGTIFHRDLSEPVLYARHKQMIADAVIAYVTHSPEEPAAMPSKA